MMTVRETMRMRSKGARWRADGVALLTLLVLSLVACDLPWSQPAATQPALSDAQQVLRLSLSGAANAIGLKLLDPAWPEPEGSASQALTLIYSSLLTYDAQLRPVPALADSVNITPGGLHYTFHIRRGARFSDGTPITSADAAFSIARLALASRSQIYFAFSALAGYSDVDQQVFFTDDMIARSLASGPLARALLMPDPATLVIQLSRPDGALLTKLAAPFSSVIERSLALRYGNDWPDHLADPDVRGASGMFAVMGWQAATRARYMTVTLTRSANYWGQRPRLRRVIVTFTNGLFGQDAVDFQHGMQDVALGVSADPNDGATQLAGFHVMPSRSQTVLLFNYAAPPSDDPRVREALALALDRHDLVSSLYQQGTPSATLIPPGTPGYMAKIGGKIAGAPLTGDQVAGRTLWLAYVQDHCGRVVSACPPVWLCDNGPYCSGDSALTQAMIGMWKAALPGIEVTTLYWVGLLGSPPNQPVASVAVVRWNEDFPDPQDWTTNLVTYTPWAGNPPPPPGWTLAQAAESAPTTGARLTEFQLAQASLINDVDALPLAQGEYAWLARKGVTSFPANPLPWVTPDEWARVYLTSPAG